VADPVAQHAALLVRIEEDSDGCEDTSAEALVGALRAVVELHRPITCRPPVCSASTPDDGPRPDTPRWPCKTIRAVAEVLGVDLDG
jgi:hypothetical protein